MQPTIDLEELADLLLTQNLAFGEEIVRVDATGVSVGPRGGTPRLHIPLINIKSARTEALVGGAKLEVRTKDQGTIAVAAFTAQAAPRFSELARGIEQLAKGEPLNIKLAFELIRCTTCGRRLPEKDGRCPACVKRGQVFRRILGYLGPYKTSTTLVIGSSILMTSIETFARPFLTRTLTDDVLAKVGAPRAIPDLILCVGALFAAMLIATALQWFKNYNSSFLSANVAKDLRGDIYKALEHLQMSFFDKKQVGGIVSRVTQDTDRVWGFLIDGVPYLLTGSFTIVGALIAGALLSWKLALAILLPVPFVGIIGSFIWKPMASKYHKVGQKWGRLHTQLNESLSGIRVVKAFVREDGEWNKFSKRNGELAMSGMVADRWWYRSEAVVNLFIGTAPLINWGYGGYLVITGEIGFGTLMAMQILLWQVYGPLQWFGQVNQWFSRAMAGAERVFEVVDAQPETYDQPDAIKLPVLKGDVKFTDVRFGYDKSNPVLKGINLEIKAGEMIGLVGRSGAGKSTTMNLLCRFYEVDSGTLTVDGIDVKDIALEDLRKHIGIVLQEPFLFNGTIAENIAYGKPGASIEDVIAAARAACAHEFIVQKPDGYDTQVGEKGSRLSGGERQRVSIARAILNNPRILILDEATSSVDVETEKRIQQAIGNLTAGRTTFAIAHRLSTLRNADRLVVLEKGQIVEQGTHTELMDKKGVFYKLVETQKQTSKALAEDVAFADVDTAVEGGAE